MQVPMYFDLGLATTPYVYYATAAKGFKASVQITASHNPKDDNGLKVSRENALPVGYDTGLGTIEKWILGGRECVPVPEADRGRVTSLDLRTSIWPFSDAMWATCPICISARTCPTVYRRCS